MTAEQAKLLGYVVKPASYFEVGLTYRGQGLRTWWSSDFDRQLPGLDHPKIQEAIRVHEENEKWFQEEQRKARNRINFP